MPESTSLSPETRDLVRRWITLRGRHIPLLISTVRGTKPRKRGASEQNRIALQRARNRRNAVIRVDRHLDDIVEFCDRKLNIKSTTLDKTFAAVVKLINECYFRVGSEEYVQANNTYGVTTLRSEHVVVEGNIVSFKFNGKKGVLWERQVVDPRLAKFIQHLKDGAGDGPLFWYIRNGKRKILTRDKVTSLLKKRWGITAKDFRTYYATALCLQQLFIRSAKPGEKLSKREIKKRVSDAVAHTAVLMGHTPSVCRASYLMPGLLEDFIENGGRIVLEPLQKLCSTILGGEQLTTMVKRNAKTDKGRTIIPSELRDQIEVREVKCADGVTRTKLFDIETGKPVIIRDLPRLDLSLFRSWLAGYIRRTARMQKGYRLRVVSDDADAPELVREDLDTNLGVRPKRSRSTTKRRSRPKKV